jgi:uncharacterized protein (DUF488 family)
MSVEPGEDTVEEPLVIYSIGHSNHTFEKFLSLAEQHHIEVIADVRSQPYSRYVSHFNYPEIEMMIKQHHIQYEYMGKELGGRPPEGHGYYDAEGYVLYDQVAQANFFRKGIERIKDLAATKRMAIMCSEENPAGCHRRLLIGRVLREDGIVLMHIRGDGQMQTEDELTNISTPNAQYESTLWGEPTTEPQETAKWKSIHPVLHRKLPANSSSPYDEQEYAD